VIDPHEIYHISPSHQNQASKTTVPPIIATPKAATNLLLGARKTEVCSKWEREGIVLTSMLLLLLLLLLLLVINPGAGISSHTASAQPSALSLLHGMRRLTGPAPHRQVRGGQSAGGGPVVVRSLGFLGDEMGGWGEAPWRVTKLRPGELEVVVGEVSGF